MQLLHSYKRRVVHIISVWIIGVFLGMLFLYCFQRDFVSILQHDPDPCISLFSLFLTSLIPLLLGYLFLRLHCYSAMYIIIFIKAFLYGFAVLLFSVFGLGANFMLFSQACSCVLMILFFFLSVCIRRFSLRKLLSVFLAADFFLVLVDYFFIYPMYS